MNCPCYFGREDLDYSSHTTITDFYRIESGLHGHVIVEMANVSIVMFAILVYADGKSHVGSHEI